jgi:hypothetical protein
MELSLSGLSDDAVHVFGVSGEDCVVLAVDILYSTASTESTGCGLKAQTTLT